MKKRLLIVTIVLGTLGSYQAFAQSPSSTQSANATMKEQAPFAKETPKLVTPLNLPPRSNESSAINRAGGISSQPWAQTAEREQLKHNYPNDQTPEPKFDLLSVNFGLKH